MTPSEVRIDGNRVPSLVPRESLGAHEQAPDRIAHGLGEPRGTERIAGLVRLIEFDMIAREDGLQDDRRQLAFDNTVSSPLAINAARVRCFSLASASARANNPLSTLTEITL